MIDIIVSDVSIPSDKGATSETNTYGIKLPAVYAIMDFHAGVYRSESFQ